MNPFDEIIPIKAISLMSKITPSLNFPVLLYKIKGDENDLFYAELLEFSQIGAGRTEEEAAEDLIESFIWYLKEANSNVEKTMVVPSPREKMELYNELQLRNHHPAVSFSDSPYRNDIPKLNKSNLVLA
ncbi:MULTISPECIES: hypothetical protein [Leptospira]|uniref:hypothetical protein n=1 Tax=Leptospira TaxID=171 RepID=UPI00035D5FCC|nr:MULTISPECIES: hypothetical protein [Leptospira]OMI16700.1 hypothetical protein BUQ74_14000 [Leptospira weilii serovar Heyan]ULH29233.1 hypothetical protein FH586_04765 [Leptospira weilii]UPY81133.1 hypothetical protein FH581_023045 [Leptospira weilii]UPY81222.1 hypothetical protein FH581_023530 [Leptospira weilii]